MDPSESEVTQILSDIENGFPGSADRLMPAVYDELRRMAAAKLVRERADLSLAATGLVHEAYLRLVGDQSFASRKHFFGAAAEAMRRILIDRARARSADKRGGSAARVDLAPDQLVDWNQPSEKLELLDEALDRFSKIEPEKAELVKLRYFVGLKIYEAAEILGISTATADRYWAYSRAWLQTEMA